MIRCKCKVETERMKRTDKGKSRYVGHHEKEVGPLCQKPQSLSVKWKKKTPESVTVYDGDHWREWRPDAQQSKLASLVTEIVSHSGGTEKSRNSSRDACDVERGEEARKWRRPQGRSK